MLQLIVSVMRPKAESRSGMYNDLCERCHGTTSTCDGCHAHGVHSSSAKNDLNITGVTNKTSYAAGETVSVTINGGYKDGWVRAVLYDHTMKEIARSSGASFPVTLTAPAPSAAGTYTWNVAWYGHENDIAGAYFGPRWTPDPATPGHGSEIVSTNAFTVVAAAAPDINLNPASIDFGTVTIGSSVTKSTKVENLGTAALTVTGISRCTGTSTEYTWSPAAPFTVAPGGSVTLSVVYKPVDEGTDTGCLAISSNDPATAVVNLGLTGTGVAPQPVVSDYDIAGFRCSKRASVGDTVTLKVVIKNMSTTDPGALLTITGDQGGMPITVVTDIAVFDPVSDGRTTYSFTYTPMMSGAITWTATIEDADPDIDQALCATTVVP